MSLVIRKIEKEDYKDVEVLTREAFWNVYRPGCSEHLVVHNIHKDKKAIEDLELVILSDNKVVGHIVYTMGCIKGNDSEKFIAFGPISVMPKFQGKEIGSKLIRISIQKAKRMGYSAVFITGNPEYYKKFGFESASKYNIHMDGVDEEDSAPFFMVRVLDKDALEGISGTFEFDSCYNVKEEDVDMFDRKFSFKNKEVKEGQLNL